MLFPYVPKPILLGTDTSTGEKVHLAPHWLNTHLHILGPPGMGKTRLLLSIYAQLIKRPDATVIVMNPKGDLISMARDAAINAGQSKRLVLFDPANTEHVIGYNPLRPNGLTVGTHAKAAREAFRAAWGQASFDGTPQLARFLFLALCAARELELTLVEAVQLLRVGSVVRGQVLARLKNSFVREALEYLDSLRDSRQEEMTASTLARLEAFVMDETIRRIVSRQTDSLDLGELIDRRQILLVNLEQYKPLRPDDVRLLGRMMINDIVAHVFARTGRRTPVFLIIDECQTFTTQDLCLALDQGRELGLHCILSHQFPGQLLREDESGLLYGSVTECARTKIIFGGMHVENLETTAKDLFISEFNPMKVKDERKSLELEPVESVRPTFTLGFNAGISTGSTRSDSLGFTKLRGESETHGEAESVGTSVGQGTGSALQNSDSEMVSIGTDGAEALSGRQTSSSSSDSRSSTETASQSATTSNSHSVQRATTESSGTVTSGSSGVSAGVSAGVSLQPFYEYVKRYVVSSRTFESFEEFLITAMQRLKAQTRGHFVLKTPTGRPTFLRAPYVGTPVVRSRTVLSVLQNVFSRPCYATPLQIEQEELARVGRLSATPERLLITDRSHAKGPISYKRSKRTSES